MSSYDVARLDKALQEFFPGGRLTVYQQISSTNDAAKALPLPAEQESGAEPRLSLLLAERQTAGRGRLGRAWSSPPAGDIYMSLVLDGSFSLALSSVLPLAAGYAVHQALLAEIRRQQTGEAQNRPNRDGIEEALLRLKWPNDVVYASKKICGILCESQLAAAGERSQGRERAYFSRLIVGVGVNVSRLHFPSELEPIAVSLRQLAPQHSWSREAIIRDFLKAWQFFWSSDLSHPETLRQLLEHYRPLCLNIGKKLQFHTAEGQVRTGVGLDIDPQGGLVVRYPSGEITSLYSGEVTFSP